ncbi:MAG TPA: hypothetical protein VN577_20150 [Terriglobales bacterium]|nr:hypothetical protein [Clostridia bacterium]HWR17153.1 hypothetical protein [Terriglobales bacterium]
MSARTILSRPQILGRIESARINLNLTYERYVKARSAADTDFETAMVYAISARESIDRAIADLKALNPESEAANG